MQLGIHHVDTLSYWLGPVRRASGRFAHVHTPADIDDVGVVTLEFESGALGSLTGSYVSPKTLSLRLLGTEAVLDYRTDFSVWPDARALDGATTLTLDGDARRVRGARHAGRGAGRVRRAASAARPSRRPGRTRAWPRSASCVEALAGQPA